MVAGMSAVAEAAPNIPSSELPGRARQQFLESPIDRFTQPGQKELPCGGGNAIGRKPKAASIAAATASGASCGALLRHARNFPQPLFANSYPARAAPALAARRASFCGE